MSLLEVAEDVMRGQGTQNLRAPEYPNTPPKASLQKADYNADLHADREKSRRFCVNMPCIPLNLEVSLPTLYVIALISTSH